LKGKNTGKDVEVKQAMMVWGVRGEKLAIRRGDPSSKPISKGDQLREKKGSTGEKKGRVKRKGTIPQGDRTTRLWESYP